VLIRTILWRPDPPDPIGGADAVAGDGELSFQVGGGITWSSQASAEDRETLDKAAGLIDALRLGASGSP
jgi:hypothetical protein